MAKIAAALERAVARRTKEGTPGSMTSRVIARGEGWTVADVVCTSGPQDAPFEERHTSHVIAVVIAGSFQYRSAAGHDVLTPGSLMLGNRGQCFECGHEHGQGDRCVAFWYAPDYFEQLAADVRPHRSRAAFDIARLPPLRALAPLVAYAGAGATGPADVPWEELAIRLAARALTLAAGAPPASSDVPPNAVARVTRLVQAIERQPGTELTLGRLARAAGLSPYHFLRTFERVTGVTPHQYVLRARLRQAALRLASGSDKVVDVAFDCGFGDVSNFNRAFRAEFGVSPRVLRRTLRQPKPVTAELEARISG